MTKLTAQEKKLAWTAGTKAIKFVKDLKRHVQLEPGFTGQRAAYALRLLDTYINGEFLNKIQAYKRNETETK